MDGIDIKVHRVGLLNDIILFKVSGFIDTSTAADFHKELTQYIDKGNIQFVIDLEDVQYVSSAGWSVFVSEIRGIREKGGDLKLTQMLPEVYEVFEMLEFNRIISSYDTIEEAIDEFDFCRDLHPSSVPTFKESNTITLQKTQFVQPADGQSFTPPSGKIANNSDVEIKPFTPATSRKKSPKVDEPKLPINEKLKRIILENPGLGIRGIKSELNSERFGYTKLGFFRIKNHLKNLNLETKSKRYRYFRSR